MREKVSIGIDIGGTFTDVVAIGDSGRLRIAKVPSTRSDPSAAVRTVLQKLLPEWGIAPRDVVRFAHGTTVATNAVLERKGARLGLLASEGFTDVIEIGRQNRRQIYELILKPETPVFLVPGARRKGVRESIGPRGEVIVPLDEASLERSVDELVAQDVEAIAVCFLYAFINPAHERQVRDHIARRYPRLIVSLSSDVVMTVTECVPAVRIGFCRRPRGWRASRRPPRVTARAVSVRAPTANNMMSAASARRRGIAPGQRLHVGP